ncbi:OmpH family outer membrane protein [Nafulsella turpanensis]|uniref:OmpH family outer membrane protein n=1 Tax=Nafulsella turpanensis TaxID=1265690 RepID=UPI00037CA528|nr:OmpH family outer membrane protein [Nafulsella turpanensis]
MKRHFFLIFFLFLVSNSIFGQKFGYVDTNYILGQMPEFAGAQQEIEKVSLAWQDEIKDKQKEIDAMYSALQAEEVLLTEAMKKQRLAEIKKKEEELKEYQKQVFGFEGLFFLKQQEILQPVQEKVFEAVETVAVKQKLQIVFDKAGGLTMIYTNPVHDYTDYVLEELGLGDKTDTIK